MPSEPWQNEVIELEWRSYEAMGREEATVRMNLISVAGGKAMSVHFVGLGQVEKNTMISGRTPVVVPIFNIFALMPKEPKRG
jgi:hypothetical protein